MVENLIKGIETPHSDRAGKGMMEYKGYSIESDGTFGMKVIKPLGRGSVPKILRGKFTKYSEAQNAIDRYEATKGKGRKNDEADNIS